MENSEIIQVAQRLERVLTSLGAQGAGLGQKVISIKSRLPKSIVDDILKINNYRNRIVHDDLELEIPQIVRNDLREACIRVINYFEHRGGKSDTDFPEFMGEVSTTGAKLGNSVPHLILSLFIPSIFIHAYKAKRGDLQSQHWLKRPLTIRRIGSLFSLGWVLFFLLFAVLYIFF